MPSEEEIRTAARILAASRHAVVLTGAGHSTPSGIPDFRSPASGLWERSDPMVVASLVGFHRNPRAFYDWIRPLARQMVKAEPNPAHHALAKLEQLRVVKAVITQNIDQLHQKAGSRRVLELHGSIRTATCTLCGDQTATDEMWLSFFDSDELPRCRSCGAVLKPDVILFGELLPEAVLLEALSEAEQCDAMLVAGSSLEVYPAADLPARAVGNGAKLIIVNYEPTHMDSRAQVVLHEDVAMALPQIAERIAINEPTQ